MFKHLDIAFVRVSEKIDIKCEKYLSQARAIVHFESIGRLTIGFGNFKLINVVQSVTVYLRYEHKN